MLLIGGLGKDYLPSGCRWCDMCAYRTWVGRSGSALADAEVNHAPDPGPVKELPTV